MITAAKIIQNQKNILSERAKCTFCFVLIKQNLAQNVLRKGNNLFCRLYYSDYTKENPRGLDGAMASMDKDVYSRTNKVFGVSVNYKF